MTSWLSPGAQSIFRLRLRPYPSLCAQTGTLQAPLVFWCVHTFCLWSPFLLDTHLTSARSSLSPNTALANRWLRSSLKRIQEWHAPTPLILAPLAFSLLCPKSHGACLNKIMMSFLSRTRLRAPLWRISQVVANAEAIKKEITFMHVQSV